MKLIMAIVHNSDVKSITEEMMKGSFSLTKIGSTGGILKSGMTTLISAVRNERVQQALDIISTSSHSRKYAATSRSVDSTAYGNIANLGGDLGGEIVVGGATVFVLNIEENYKF